MDGEERFRTELMNPKLNGDMVYALILADSTLVDAVFRELSNKASRIKFGCSKSLLLLSQYQPALLAPKLDQILKLLGSENQILKWNAIGMIGNLASADREHQVMQALPSLCGFLSCGELITANHAIAALAKIGRIFPQKQKTITARLLEVENAVFDTDECRNIAIGKVIEGLKVVFGESACVPAKVMEFARRQTANRRNATAKKAESFLRMFSEKRRTRNEPAFTAGRN